MTRAHEGVFRTGRSYGAFCFIRTCATNRARLSLPLRRQGALKDTGKDKLSEQEVLLRCHEVQWIIPFWCQRLSILFKKPSEESHHQETKHSGHDPEGLPRIERLGGIAQEVVEEPAG